MLTILRVLTVLLGLGVGSLMFAIGFAPMIDGMEKGDVLIANAKGLFPIVLIAFACCLGAMIAVASRRT